LATTLDPLDPAAAPSRAPRDEISARPTPWRRAADVWRYRELLGNLTRKELKIKYKNSVLGFVWSLLNPALYLVVFYIVFQVIMKNGQPNFAIYLLAGLLPWNLFSAGLAGGTGSIVSNAGLVGKVWFPREILPLASIGAALVHFFLQLLVLFGALLVFRYPPAWEYLPLLVVGLIVLLAFTAAVAVGLAAINVYLRDTQHLLELALLAWFWMTPIVYSYTLMQKVHLIGNRFLLNPLADITITFQRAIYAKPAVKVNGVMTNVVPDQSQWWYLRNLGLVFAASIVIMLVSLWIFGRLEDNIAEEL
jgi:ABC-2 type transport system permease protein